MAAGDVGATAMSHPAVSLVTVAAPGTAGALNGHGWHLIEGIGFLVISLGGIALAEFIQARRRRRGSSADARAESPQTTAGRPMLLPLVALSSIAAAGVHFVVMPEHFEEATLYGTFFLVAATSQLVYAAYVLLRPSPAVLGAGALGNLAIVALWLVTRLVGIPLGPAAGSTESFGGLDVLAAVFELTTAVAAFALIRKPRWPRNLMNPARWSRVIWALGAGAAVAIASTAIVAPPS
jgi:hypothetical protein